jgi:hypothetical protein
MGDLVEVDEKKIGKCRHCGDRIAWLTSQRTGKNYPVNINEYEQDQLADGALVKKNDFHQCR